MRKKRMLKVALVQFDAIPEKPETNCRKMKQLAAAAARKGARLVMFHEGTFCDYTPHLDKLAEPVPSGKHVRAMERLAKELGIYISYGLSERDGDRFYITQVFNAPHGFLYKYRKTWLWYNPPDVGYRNEHARYDPGVGPELFEIDGIRATCFVCADGEAPRCIERVRALRPQLVFYPNNRGQLPDFPVFGKRARRIGAPMLVTNRIGQSWTEACVGGCVVYDAKGQVFAAANRKGRQEILVCEVPIE